MASSAEQMASNISLGSFSKATDLKKRLWFTLGALVVFRLLSFVPLPGIDPRSLATLFQSTQGGVLDFFNMFSGGGLERMSLIAMGVMPYITASIVMQLATTMSPQLGALKKEGESGRKKINQYTRYGTVILCIIQGYFMAVGLEILGRDHGPVGGAQPRHDVPHHHRDQPGRRHHVPDVARRADHQPRHRQRHFPDHHGGHRRPAADRARAHVRGRPLGQPRCDGDHPDHRHGRDPGPVHLLHGAGAAPGADPISQAPDRARPDPAGALASAAEGQHVGRDPADLRLLAAAAAADHRPVRRPAARRARAPGAIS